MCSLRECVTHTDTAKLQSSSLVAWSLHCFGLDADQNAREPLYFFPSPERTVYYVGSPRTAVAMSQLKSMMKADAGKAAGNAAGKDQHIREAIEVRARSPPRRCYRGVRCSS